jgi:hypothetical protein
MAKEMPLILRVKAGEVTKDATLACTFYGIDDDGASVAVVASDGERLLDGKAMTKEPVQ